MRWQYNAMVFLIATNMAIFMLTAAECPFMVGFDTTIDPASLTEKFDINETMGTWSGNPLGDYLGFTVNAIKFLIFGLVTLVIGLPMFIISMGSPLWISGPIFALWMFTWFMYFVEVIRGTGGISGD